MGYTHYYYISSEFDAKAFAKVAADFKKMVTPLKHLGVILADGAGENYPTISPTEIRFNGLEKCGHEVREGIYMGEFNDWDWLSDQELEAAI